MGHRIGIEKKKNEKQKNQLIQMVLTKGLDFRVPAFIIKKKLVESLFQYFGRGFRVSRANRVIPFQSMGLLYGRV